jgi:hypothetical protein
VGGNKEIDKGTKKRKMWEKKDGRRKRMMKG